MPQVASNKITRPAGKIARFFQGLSAPLRGFGLLSRFPLLWRYAFWPFVLNIFITALVLAMMFASASYFVYHIHPRFAGIWGRTLEVLSAIGLLILVVGMALVSWLALQAVLCSYFYERLAKATELKLGTPAHELIEVPLWASIRDSLRDVLGLIVINVGLLFLHFIPFVGSVVALPLSVYFNCLIFGRDFFGFVLVVHGMRRAQRMVFTREYRAQTMGIGASVLLLALIPFVGPLLLPCAVCGAVLQYHDITDPLRDRPLATR